MKASTDDRTTSDRTTGTGVIIRRARARFDPLPSTDTAADLRTEFHALRHRLPKVAPEERERIKARLNEILHLQKALETHAHFFLPERARLPEETVH